MRYKWLKTVRTTFFFFINPKWNQNMLNSSKNISHFSCLNNIFCSKQPTWTLTLWNIDVRIMTILFKTLRQTYHIPKRQTTCSIKGKVIWAYIKYISIQIPIPHIAHSLMTKAASNVTKKPISFLVDEQAFDLFSPFVSNTYFSVALRN